MITLKKLRNTWKSVGIFVLAWIWLPTGDPTDLFFSQAIIGLIGLKNYLMMSAVFVIYLYYTIEGDGFAGKYKTIKREIKEVLQ